MRAGTYNGQTMIIGKNLTISGGYDAGCAVRTTNLRSTLNGNNSGSVLEIAGANTILLTDLEITGGTDDADDGGGIEIDSATVTIANVIVRGNVADYGGGVHLNGGNLLLSNGSAISTNTANQNGGGIYATGTGTITLQDGTLIGATSSGAGNVALNGGGIFVANLNLTTHLVTINGSAAVRYNRATAAAGLGGGLYMQGGRLNIVSATALIAGNSAHSGGGIQANNGAQVTVMGNVLANTATFRGGGINISGATSTLALSGATVAGASPSIRRR